MYAFKVVKLALCTALGLHLEATARTRRQQSLPAAIVTGFVNMITWKPVASPTLSVQVYVLESMAPKYQANIDKWLAILSAIATQRFVAADQHGIEFKRVADLATLRSFCQPYIVMGSSSSRPAASPAETSLYRATRCRLTILEDGRGSKELPIGRSPNLWLIGVEATPVGVDFPELFFQQPRLRAFLAEYCRLVPLDEFNFPIEGKGETISVLRMSSEPTVAPSKATEVQVFTHGDSGTQCVHKKVGSGKHVYQRHYVTSNSKSTAEKLRNAIYQCYVWQTGMQSYT